MRAVSSGMEMRKVSNSKRDFQGHWYCCHSISHTHVWFPVTLPV